MAEKLDAIISLGIANSRMKDYFDLYALAREGKVDASTLASSELGTSCQRPGRTKAVDPVSLGKRFLDGVATCMRHV